MRSRRSLTCSRQSAMKAYTSVGAWGPGSRRSARTLRVAGVKPLLPRIMGSTRVRQLRTLSARVWSSWGETEARIRLPAMSIAPSTTSRRSFWPPLCSNQPFLRYVVMILRTLALRPTLWQEHFAVVAQDRKHTLYRASALSIRISISSTSSIWNASACCFEGGEPSATGG